jgi:hypothetical protein
MNRFPIATLLAVLVFSGRVLDRTTGQGLPHVVVQAGAAHATTDATGRFSMRNVKAGLADVTVKSDDVPTQHYAVRIGAGTTHHDFRACSTTLDYNCGTPALPDSGDGGSAG